MAVAGDMKDLGVLTDHFCEVGLGGDHALVSDVLIVVLESLLNRFSFLNEIQLSRVVEIVLMLKYQRRCV